MHSPKLFIWEMEIGSNTYVQSFYNLKFRILAVYELERLTRSKMNDGSIVFVLREWVNVFRVFCRLHSFQCIESLLNNKFYILIIIDKTKKKKKISIDRYQESRTLFKLIYYNILHYHFTKIFVIYYNIFRRTVNTVNIIISYY